MSDRETQERVRPAQIERTTPKPLSTEPAITEWTGRGKILGAPALNVEDQQPSRPHDNPPGGEGAVPPEPPEVPVTDPPTVADVPSVTVDGGVVPDCAVGDTLTCTIGNWNGEPTDYQQVWFADGAEVGTGPSYTAAAEDEGKSITCVVTATNDAGSTDSTSNAVTVGPQDG